MLPLLNDNCNIAEIQTREFNPDLIKKKPDILIKKMLPTGGLETNIWAAVSENMSLGIYEQQRPRLAFASTQSDQGLHCQLTECRPP